MFDLSYWLRRGAYPVEIRGAPSWAREVPGIAPNLNRATLEGYDALAHALGWKTVEPPPVELLDDERLRPYQREAAGFMRHRPFAMLDLPMQSGKTPTTLAAAESVPWMKRILCVVPRLAKWVWASHAVEWLRDGRDVVVFEGRAFQTARVVCRSCGGRGFDCEPCRGRGATIYHDQEAADLLLKERLVAVVSYDSLVPHREADGRGVVVNRGAGLGGTLATWADLVIADEAHRLRGRGKWTKDKKTDSWRFKGVERVEAFRKVTHPRGGDALGRPWVWMLSGTFVYVYTRDLFTPLSLGTGGVYGDPKLFDVRFCEGHKGAYGWQNTGRSVLAESELPRRLAWYRFKRNRADLAADLPPKQRSVMRVEVSSKVQDKVRAAFRDAGDGAAGHQKALAEAARLVSASKWDEVLEVVEAQIAEGERIVVFLFHRPSAAKFFEAVKKVCKKPELRSKEPGLWHVDGEVGELERFRVAERFRHWTTRPGVLVATIDSMTESLSLAGAAYVHFIDLHWSASAMLQAEDRPYRVGVSRLSVWYWTADVPSDHRMLESLRTKAATADKILADTAQAEFAAALGASEESDEEKAERLFARIVVDLEAMDDVD